MNLQPAGRMGVAGVTALGFGPSHYGRGPLGPPFDLRAVATGISLVAQIEQADVPERLGTEAADFEIVFHHGQRAAQFADTWLEEAPLVIETRAPGQHAADVQAFPSDLGKHARGR